jgi:hypothetical protein
MKKFEKAWSQIVAKAWSDEAFKARLLAEPAAVLKENGIPVPEGLVLRVVEDSATVGHLILPLCPPELTEADLDQIAAGGTMYTRIQFPSGLNYLNPQPEPPAPVLIKSVAIPGGDTN